MNHFTDKAGFDGIRSQRTWLFVARQPNAPHHPVGAYFTDYAATEPNLAKKIRVPRAKLAYVFAFSPPRPLKLLPGGRGRLRRILYSPTDYPVNEPFQRFAGKTELA